MASPTGSSGPSQSAPKAPMAAPENTDLPITKIGKYTIKKKIGAGGMGAVYLAEDATLRRICALKVLPPEKAGNATLVKRFRAEAVSAANLRHENIVAVYETGEADGYLYIALEYVEGTDVANLVNKRGTIPLKRSIEMVRQVASALEHALQQEIVHRDIKPGNLLVRRDGVVKLADLGLARSLDENVDTSITRAGTTVGTVDYMSPEQARDSKAADVRSDIYSLGCTWYYMLTGEPPFPDGSLTNKLRSHAETPIPDPRKLNPAVSEAVYGVLQRMCDKKPARRYQTPKELLDDLEKASLNGDLVSNAILSDDADSGEAASKARYTATVEYGEDDGPPGYVETEEPRRGSKRSKPSKQETEDDREAETFGAGGDDVFLDDISDAEDREAPSPPRKMSKPSKRDAADDDAPSGKRAPQGKARDKEKLSETEEPKKRTNAPLFYAMVGLAVIGITMGIVWIISEFDKTSFEQSDRMANPFARRDEVKQNSGPGQGTSTVGANAGAGTTTGGGTPGVGPNANDGQPGPGGTTIGGSGQQGDSGSNAIGGQGGPVVDKGSISARVGGDGTPGAGDTPATGGTGSAAGAGGTGGSTIGGNTGGSGTSTAGPASVGNTTIGGSSGSSAGNTTIGQAGAKNTSGGSKASARPSSPHIEARTKQETAFLPGWASQQRPASNLATIVVQPGAAGDGKVASLNEAFEKIGDAGALIRLAGNGPFPLYPVKIADKTRIVIEPADAANSSAAPVIVLLPPKDDAAVSNFVEVVNTTLDLRGVHLALDADGFETDADDAMLSAVGSDLFLQNCSLSAKGMPESPMTAVKIAGKVKRTDAKAGSQPRVLIDNTVIRGNKLTALTVNSEYVDLVARNSVIWSGAATAVRFGPIARTDGDSARTVHLASTTLCSLTCAVQIAGDASQPVPTSFDLLNSLIAASSGADAPVLLNLEGWNQNQQKSAFGKFINWKSTASLYTGWSTLIRLNPGAQAVATSSAQWQKEWKEKEKGQAEKDQFQEATWPGQRIADIAAAGDLEALAPQTVGKQYVKTGEGGWPGCQTERLTIANVGSLVPAQVAATRPALPKGLFQAPVREVLRVDVTKDDLGKFLAGRKLQNGTQIVAVGSGVRQSSPIVIENAWVSLKFEQAEGAPLVLVPKAGDGKYDGFISIVNGGMEIFEAAFTTPASQQQAVPKWMIQAIDSDLAMWRCRVQSSLTSAARNKGLIQVLSRNARPPSRVFEGSYDGYTWFEECFLAGSGTMVEADTRRRALVAKNCVIVSRDDLFAFNVGQPDAQIGGVVDFRNSTLSAADQFFQVRCEDLGRPSSSALAVYADRCVFAPPLRAGQQKVTPTLLTYSGPMLEQKQLQWWEKRCGYAPEITRFLRAESDNASSAQDFEGVWVQQWGSGQVSEALLGVKGVVLQKELPTKTDDRAKLEPTDFVLQSGSRAAAWDDKRPIGAPVVQMNVPAVRPSAAAAAEKKKPVKAVPPGSGNAPVF